MGIRLKFLLPTASKTLIPASSSPWPSHYTNWAIPVSILVPEYCICSKILLVTDYISRSSSPLKIGPISCPETSAEKYHSTLRKIPEERRSHLHRGLSLKPCTDVYDITESVSKLMGEDNISSDWYIFTKVDTNVMTTHSTQRMNCAVH